MQHYIKLRLLNFIGSATWSETFRNSALCSALSDIFSVSNNEGPPKQDNLIFKPASQMRIIVNHTGKFLKRNLKDDYPCKGLSQELVKCCRLLG